MERLKAGCLAAGAATSRLRPLPEFLIIGGQRCGTTALYDSLLRHPGIRAPSVKEVHYFDLQFGCGERWYRAHFPTELQRAAVRRRTGHDLVTGEASPYYLFHPRVPGRAHELLPDARLVVMVRDPVKRAYSHYHHEVSLGMETLGFEQALDAEPHRLAGEAERIASDPGYVSVSHQHHSYKARGLYLDQLRAWLEWYPREQLLILRSEDFFADPGGVIDQVLEFIGAPPHALGRHARPGSRRYPPLNEATRARLAEHFAEPNRQLEAFLGRDLGWGG
ncbi:MAG: sulfotransferase domain-containing protein [Gaiellales bacterium]